MKCSTLRCSRCDGGDGGGGGGGGGKERWRLSHDKSTCNVEE